MRQYHVIECNELARVVCNGCGKELRVENGYLKEECFSAEQIFGYFSKKDGVRHQFDLCEECYERIIGSFAVPVDEDEVEELL